MSDLKSATIDFARSVTELRVAHKQAQMPDDFLGLGRTSDWNHHKAGFYAGLERFLGVLEGAAQSQPDRPLAGLQTAKLEPEDAIGAFLAALHNSESANKSGKLSADQVAERLSVAKTNLIISLHTFISAHGLSNEKLNRHVKLNPPILAAG